MILRSRKNRRRFDVAKKTGELSAAARSHGPMLLKLVLLTAISAGSLWGAFEGWRWATTSPRFALTQVTYQGLSKASEAELSRLGGLTPGSNLFAMDVDAAERALATHPWVKSVRATRRFPSRIQVEVEEHTPVALLALGELYLVDQDGVPFKRVAPQDGLDLPLVTGLERERFVEDRQAALGRLSQAVDAAVTYSRSAGAKKEPLSEVNLQDGEVTVITLGGQQIRFGDGALTDKLARLQQVRAELSNRQLTAAVIRLDDRHRPSRVTVQLSASSPERGPGAAH